MAEARRRAAPASSKPAREVGFLLLGTIVLGGGWFFLLGLLHRIDALETSIFASLVTVLQWTGVALMGLVAILGAAAELRKARARQATEQVAEALEGTDAAGASAEELAALLKSQGAKVDTDQLKRLVEQRRQQLLIDDEAFRTEVSALIVDYLQPLPRNAKRVLNRFRVNLLIAHQRELFTTDPKVTRQQIGKWLVLGERWPQLRMVLSAEPEKMKVLEERARTPVPPPAGGGQAAPPDSFTDTLRTLAPFYAGDEDLRRFMQSAPSLAAVLARLVHYGGAQPPAAA